MRYTLVQRSMWSAFVLDIVDGAGTVVGEVRSPTVFQYRNARLAVHPRGSTAGNVKFAFDGVAYEVCVDVLRRASAPDVRYTLERDGQACAVVDVVRQRGVRFPAVLLREPLSAAVRRTGSAWRRRFELRDDRQRLATVFHPHRVTLRMHLAVDIAPGSPVLPLVFAAYVVKELLY